MHAGPGCRRRTRRRDPFGNPNAKCKMQTCEHRRAHHQTQVEVREKMTASWTWTCFSIDPNQDPQQLGGGGQIFSDTHCRMPARRWRDPLLSRWSSSSCCRRRRRSGQVDRCQAVETAGQSTKTDPAFSRQGSKQNDSDGGSGAVEPMAGDSSSCSINERCGGRRAELMV